MGQHLKSLNAKPPQWCPWIPTAESDLKSFSLASNRFCSCSSLKAHLKEILDEEEEEEAPAIDSCLLKYDGRTKMMASFERFEAISKRGLNKTAGFPSS